MVGYAKYRKIDPGGKRRGAGWYYHRGKGVYSKQEDERDLGIHAETRIMRGDWRRKKHMGDRRVHAGKYRWL